MTDDEAFIRGILARPGDDLPRLVYADYLDERDDPRGTYLRAEVEWAKKPRRMADTKLRKLGAALDIVWVARVSRPPLGVCCDHVTFTKSGPRLTEKDLAQASERLGCQLPVQLRAFLLNQNGGIPSRKWLLPKWQIDRLSLDVVQSDPDCYSEVDCFFGVVSSWQDDIVEPTLDFRERGLPDALITIALISDIYTIVVMRSTGKTNPVYLWNDEGEEYDPESLTLQSNSLAGFLAQLTDEPQSTEL